MHPVKFIASHSICNKSSFGDLDDFYGRMSLERVVKRYVIPNTTTARGRFDEDWKQSLYSRVSNDNLKLKTY